MEKHYYKCLPSYECRCSPGKLVSLKTARRHRDAALLRLREKDPNRTHHLGLPNPVTEVEESVDESFQSPSRNVIGDASVVLTASNHEENVSRRDDSSSDCIGNVVVHVESDNKCISSGSDVSDSVVYEGEPGQVPEFVGLDISSHSDSDVESGGEEDSMNYDGGSFREGDVSPSSPGTSDQIHIDTEDNEYCFDEGRFDDQQACPLYTAEDKDKIAEFMADYGWCIGFYLRHNVSLEGMDDLNRRLRPNDAVVWKTVRNRLAALSGIRVQFFPYCSRGHQALRKDPVSGVVNACNHKDCAKEQAPIRELRYICLRERLQAMFQSRELGPHLLNYVRDSYLRQYRDNSAEYEDFYSGSCFRQYAATLEDFSLSECSDGTPRIAHVFLFLATDGAPAFRSTTHSFWPVIIFVGNIPPDQRYEVRHILPLMCIPGNPDDLESFLEPLFDELKELEVGFNCTLWDGSEIEAKAHVIFVLTDLQANRKISKLKGVNGICPCRFCLISGLRNEDDKTYYYPDHIKNVKRGRGGMNSRLTRTLWKPNNLPMRTVEETEQTFIDLENLEESGTKADLEDLKRDTGIIARPEVVRRLDAVRPFDSMPVDLMHLLFENVAPYMVKIWVGDINTDGEHDYLGGAATLRQVDAILLKAGSGIPDELRRPRRIKEKGSWKADEWRTFVLTTSLVALHQFLPDNILKGWFIFHQLCELATRPWLSAADLRRLSDLAISFYRHYSLTYYQGRSDRLYLMKYVMHLLLHIGHSTACCGPLICLSQFSTERYIGVIKNATNARYKYSESVSVKWTVEQAAYMLSFATGTLIPLLDKPEERLLDRRAMASNLGMYAGYWLRGPVSATDVRRLSDDLGFQVGTLLARFYESDLGITRAQASRIVNKSKEITAWNRLFIRKPSDSVLRKYTRYLRSRHARARSYFAAEFQSGGSPDEVVDVYYGDALYFLEHAFVHPVSGALERRILVLARWVTRGLRLGRQKQLFSFGSRESTSVFSSKSIEDVSCISRNICVIESPNASSTRVTGSTRTYFVDDHLYLDNLLRNGRGGEDCNKMLRGLYR